MGTSLPPFLAREAKPFLALSVTVVIVRVVSSPSCEILRAISLVHLYNPNLRKQACLAVGICVRLTTTEPVPAFLKDPETESDNPAICPISFEGIDDSIFRGHGTSSI